MIELLAAQIYPSPFALLRENVQNSFDAILMRIHKRDPLFKPKIEITIEPTSITVTDNGIGMSSDDLRNHFWKAGSSSKNTSDARAAGVVGTFGIGAMANFGIAEELIVTTESAKTGERTRSIARRSTLSVTEDCIEVNALATEGKPGTEVKAIMQPSHSINVHDAVTYISSFVEYLEVPVVVNGNIVSGHPLEDGVPKLVETWRFQENSAQIGPGIKANVGLSGAVTGEVRIDLTAVELDGTPIPGRMILRQGIGALRTFRSKFGLATAGISSNYNFGGVADFLFLQPTAGREALTTDSLQALQRLATAVEQYVSLKLAERPESNANNAFVQWAYSHGRWDICRHLRVRIEPNNNSAALFEIADRSQQSSYLVYTGSDPATIQHASQDRPLVVVSRGSPRREVELNFLKNKCKIEELTDDPRVLSEKDTREYTLAESAVVFQLSSILSTEYFVNAEFRFGEISHGLPVLITQRSIPLKIVLNPQGNTVKMMLDIYDREYAAFGHLAKDFARNTLFPKISDLVPSATRQGAEAFLKSIQRNREIFEYEADDLENLASLWKDYLEGKVTQSQASSRANTISRSFQIIDSAAAASVREVAPDMIENEEATRGDASFGPAPSIQRPDIATERKLLTIDHGEPALKGYRCFLAITDRVRDEKGEFFLQPHRTSVVWGGQKALFIFEHQSGSFGLYYDLQTPGLIAEPSGGGSFETCTIVMKNRIFIPLPEALRSSFLPRPLEKKRFEVRCDILYIDAKGNP